MITTKDAKAKVARPDEKLTVLTTGKHKPQEFIITGKEKPRDKRMITTGNVEQFQREQKLLSDEEKKFAAKAKRAVAAQARKEKAAKAKAEKEKAKQTEALVPATMVNQEDAIKENYQMVEVKVKAGKKEK